MFCLPSHRHQPLPISPDTTHHNMPGLLRLGHHGLCNVGVYRAYATGAYFTGTTHQSAVYSIMPEGYGVVPDKKPGCVQNLRLTLQWTAVRGVFVESRELAGVCRISVPIFVHKPSHTVVRCGVWCLGKSLAVKLTYDRLWCVVSGKKPWVHRCMYVYIGIG